MPEDYSLIFSSITESKIEKAQHSQILDEWFNLINKQTKEILQIYLDIINSTPRGVLLLQENPDIAYEILSLYSILFDNFFTVSEIKIFLIELNKFTQNFDVGIINSTLDEFYKNLSEYHLV